MSNYPPLWDAAAVGNYVTPARFFLIVNQTLVQYQGNTPHVVLPEGITKLGPGAFRGYNVESVYLPDSVSEIADNCFIGCSNLRWLRMPRNVAKISETAFQGTTGINVVTEPNSLTWQLLAISAAMDGLTLLPEGGAAPIPAPAAPVTAAPAPVAAPVSAPKPEPKAPAAKPVQAAAPSQSNSVDLQRRLAWCELLDCDLGERPWMMESNLFGRADRLIKKIKKVDDQLLLQTILKEAPMLRIQQAALSKITNQDILKKYAFHKNPSMRITAVKKLEDQELLRQILQNDPSDLVKNEAAEHLKEAGPELKQFLASSVNASSTNTVDTITDVDELLHLAVCAKSSHVRSKALSRLPKNLYETRILNAAAALSVEITAPQLWAFNRAYEALKTDHPAFLEMMGSHYPDSTVRYLARGERDFAPSYASGMEAALANQTLSQAEVLKRKQIEFWKGHEFHAEKQANFFLFKCQEAAKEGKRSYSQKYPYKAVQGHPYTSEEVLKQHAQILEMELRSQGFQKLTIRIVPCYEEEKVYCPPTLFTSSHYKPVQKLICYAVEVSTSW